MKKDMYKLQFERRLEDSQVGGLLKTIIGFERILVMNLGEFRRFWNDLYQDDQLGEDLTLEEANRLKLEIINVYMKNLSYYIDEHPDKFDYEEFSHTNF